MNELSMFRLKLQYKSENQTTGELEKAKTEILAQCVNYTDAESLVYEIIKQYHMDKFEPCVYDIAKAKMETTDIFGTDIMAVDTSYMTNGLYQHYFVKTDDGLYEVETIVFGDKETKEKDLKRTYYIPAIDVADAMNKARGILYDEGNDLTNCLIPSAKLDKAEWVYLRPATSKEIYERTSSWKVS